MDRPGAAESGHVDEERQTLALVPAGRRVDMELAPRRLVLSVADEHLRLMDEAVHGALRQAMIATQASLPERTGDSMLRGSGHAAKPSEAESGGTKVKAHHREHGGGERFAATPGRRAPGAHLPSWRLGVLAVQKFFTAKAPRKDCGFAAKNTEPPCPPW